MDQTTEETFTQLLERIRQDDWDGALKLVPELRGKLDKLDPDELDETMDWFSERMLEIQDPDLFDKTIEFLVNNDLAEE
jgi:hypothetical protein